MKLRKPKNIQLSIASFGLPKSFQKLWLSIAFSLGEILLGLAIIFTSGVQLQSAGIIAMALFLFFSIIVYRVIHRQEIVECNCFGSLTTEPVGWGTLVRNVALTLGAILVALGMGGAHGMLGAASSFSGDDIAWLTAIAGLVMWLVFSKVREVRSYRTELGVEGSADWTGKAIPEAELRDSDDERVLLRDVSKDRAQLLIFGRPGCVACSTIIDALPEWRRAFAGAVDIRVVTSRSLVSLKEAYPSEEANALRDGSSMLINILGIPGVPSALLLGTSGLIGAGPAVGPDAVEDLMHGIRSAVTGMAAHAAG